MPFPQESFSTVDALLRGTRALPAQNANVNSTSIDLGPDGRALVGTVSDFVVDFPATTTATGQTQTVTVQDSADNSSFAAVVGLGTRVLTGASNATPATELRWRLPVSVRRYVRINIAASATTGDQSANIATFAIRT